MATMTPVKIRGKTIHVSWQRDQPKSLLARHLLDEGYTVSEISKAVPMAYSQVHQIAKKDQAVDAKARASVVKPKAFAGVGGGWGDLPPKTKPATRPQKAAILKRAEKVLKAKGPPPRVGKLRTPGLPSDIDVGACANCGYDLIVRNGKLGYFLAHTGYAAEEYLSVIQFCQAMPEVLLK